jgi:predicted TIM-barrel fold metal-dependent hydrolase
MNRFFCALIAGYFLSLTCSAQSVSELRLKDFHPVSIYKVPVTDISQASYPVIDFHSHDYPKTDREVDQWVTTMDAADIAKTMILTYSTGTRFDSAVKKYARHKDRFEIWCGFDYTDMDRQDWTMRAWAELERCHREGAKGVGELGDKGLGELYSRPVPGYGVHIDDPRLQPLLRRCGELHMPVSIHVAEDSWMYLPSDSSNDGLINSFTWKVDMTKKGILDHDQLLETLRHALANNPGTTFIACHLANCCSNLAVLGEMFDKYPNLYADIAARYGEIAPIPRFVKAFMEKYADRIVYGTDMGDSPSMYSFTFRILETADEHFYEKGISYHWPLYGLALSDSTLHKIYSGNAGKIMTQ